MNYTMTTPCAECPFLKKHSRGYTLRRLIELSSGEMPCHKSAVVVEDEETGSEFHATKDSVHCAGALIFNEKHNTPHQMARICERLGLFDASKLDMKAPVRSRK